MEDAISQLQDLGVTRGQAKKALARYNNDVARAADFIFSGAFLSDDEDNTTQGHESTMETDEQLAIRLSREEDEAIQQTSFSDNTIFKETITTPPSPAVTVENEPVQLDKSASHTHYDSSKWSVVPFKESETIPSNMHTTTTTTSSTQLMNEFSLTWWKDPEDPSERMALDDLPIGLRPPSYNFAYSPILVQALFHVTAFQETVLSFRPTPYAWGAPKNYWKGFGEPVPGYIMREVVTKRQVTKPAVAPDTMTTTLPPSPQHAPEAVDENLISLDSPQDKMATLTIDDKEEDQDDKIIINDGSEDSESSINEETAESDLPPLIVESTPMEEETVEFVDHVENEVQLMPKCLEALAELQKLFAFLGNTSRLYGNVSHYVRALNTKLTSRGWEFSDQTFEAFLDMMINGLVEADEQSDKAADTPFVPIFRSLFLLKARIEYGDDYDNEEVYYLTISLDKTMNSFHGCLDPLVYESYDMDDSSADPTISDDEDKASYKLTTFKQIPPILLIVLENRAAPKKSSFKYTIDTTIYMDRYMLEKKEVSLPGFQEMEACRKEIAKSRLKIDKLKGSGSGPTAIDKRDILIQTLSYFENKEQLHEDGNPSASNEELGTLKEMINSVKENIDSRLQNLETLIAEQREKIDTIFDTPDMKENPYELRASFHHDGKSGTGHYWAYIWVEPSEENLLEDIPAEGGWFKFCDAIVTAATEQEIMDDPVPPFSLMYVDASLPKFSREQLYACIPDELKDFVKKDNELLKQEIHDHDHPIVQGDASLISTSEDDVMFTEKAGSVQLDPSYADDNVSVGTAVGAAAAAAEHPASASTTATTGPANGEPLNYSFNGQAFSKLKERVTAKIWKVSGYPSDDYRFIKSFEDFLARSQNQLILEHLYLLYSSEQPDNHNELAINETKAREDTDLQTIWQEYDAYLSIASMITQALSCFIKKDFASALQHLMDSKRVEASWKTQMMLDMDTSTAYSGLETLTFNGIVEKYGKECLKILNNAAFTKASNPSYRTRGLEDALRIAHQAQTIIGPDNITEDPVYQSLGSLWLSFTDRASIGSELSDRQVDLLNNLIMAYLEGQVGGSSVAHSRSQSPILDDSSDGEGDDEANYHQALWQKYKQVCSESEQLLSTLEK
ncbi:hypothetical protein MAM1_0012c01281 [Mucor ambiguus]|uniref:UBA domain-containing protein n=1 Tax=Mucor ambiguus TaxID=91626 RepID=A0A0C9M0W5_9FUNG|nr:hypothetical protein MAM1_0012c01281 [Mucor ambiguus]